MTPWALICSGQGNQDENMFAWFESNSSAQALKKRALEENWLPSEAAGALAAGVKLSKSVLEKNIQPLICLFQQMVWASLENKAPDPRLVAGYSLGELSACGCAGALSPADVVRLAGIRTACMEAACKSGGMVAVLGLERKDIENICSNTGISKLPCPDRAPIQDQNAYIAIINGQRHFILGGLREKLDALAEACRRAGAERVVQLSVPVPSHTPFMSAARAPWRAAVDKAAFRQAKIPLLAGVDAHKLVEPSSIRENLVRHLCEPVRWDECLAAMIEEGCRVFFELGPGRALANMIMNQYPGVQARALCEFKTPEGAREWISTAVSRAHHFGGGDII